MEFKLTGNALKTFALSVTCLARIGNEVTLQASPSQLVLHTLNSSRSAYEFITLKPAFFDEYTVSGDQVKCSVLLKDVCAVLRTPVARIDHLDVLLPDPDASKLQWALHCHNGMKKTYRITCNVEADVQQLSLDRSRLPSSFVVRPRDLSRLLANFQTTLHEITVIATEAPTSGSGFDEVGRKAVELRSYVDPNKENDASLHTQLWIDPCEEFVQYTHTGDPVDVTFGVKELKAFLSFCEGCEVDIHLYFEKAGEPILMAPKFGDGGGSNFDATLVLATMLVSQLNNTPREPMQQQQQHVEEGSDPPTKQPNPSDHTRIWSELSASATKSAATGPSGVVEQQQQRQRERERDDVNRRNNQQRISRMNISKDPTNNNYQREDVAERQDGAEISQRHVSNWVDADEEDDDDEDAEPFVQATPPYSTYS